MNIIASPRGWIESSLKKIAKIERETVQPEKIKTGTVYLGLEHITSEGYFTETKSVEAGELASNKFVFSNRHLLYGKLRPYLKKIARPNFNGICSTDILPILPNVEVDRDYLYHYLRQPSFIELATARSIGANLPRLSPKDLADFPVVFPPIAQQRRIADILDRADAVRRKRKEAIALTEELLRSAFLEMFGDPVANPKGWESVLLEKISIIQGGLQVTTQRSTNPIEAPYLRVANVYRDQLVLDVIKLIRVTQQELNRTTLQAGDLLIVEGHGNSEEIGRSAVWNDSIPDCTHQNHLIRVRLCLERADPTYVSAFLNSPGGRRQLDKFGKTTSGLNTISTSNVKAIEILLPPIAEQKRYLEVKQRVDICFSAYRGYSQNTEKFFNSLLQRAFRGEL